MWLAVHGNGIPEGLRGSAWHWVLAGMIALVGVLLYLKRRRFGNLWLGMQFVIVGGGLLVISLLLTLDTSRYSSSALILEVLAMVSWVIGYLIIETRARRILKMRRGEPNENSQDRTSDLLP